MIFTHFAEENGWIVVDYTATWKYGYDFMLDAAQTIIDTDFKDKLQRVAVAKIAGAPDAEKLDGVAAANNNLRAFADTGEENGVLTISGASSIMECPIQICFFNQTNVVRLFCPFKKYFDEHGEHVFDNYMNSIEIKAYCKSAERDLLEKLGG